MKNSQFSQHEYKWQHKWRREIRQKYNLVQFANKSGHCFDAEQFSKCTLESDGTASVAKTRTRMTNDVAKAARDLEKYRSVDNNFEF